ncbi:MAG TPA: glutaredoxin domain-containing protein [Dehalococcoidia bacterium]|nr:glutaredoxin domain-containing protein [Dehalococcoidia bacterium]
MVKSYLTDNKIAYKEINVAEDKIGRDEMIRKSGNMVVPQIDINGEIIVGFDKAKLKEKLGIQ